jgi:hypothetical protein
MSKNIIMRSDNKGLTVKINLWPVHDRPPHFNSKMARLWIRGTITNADTGKNKFFNEAGELLSILGKWNAAKLRKFKSIKKNRISN